MNARHPTTTASTPAALIDAAAHPLTQGDPVAPTPIAPTHSSTESPTDDVSTPWSRIVTLAGLAVLGITPWASAQLAPLDPPPAVICPPLTAIATPTLFDVFFGTTPIRFPFQ